MLRGPQCDPRVLQPMQPLAQTEAAAGIETVLKTPLCGSQLHNASEVETHLPFKTDSVLLAIYVSDPLGWTHVNVARLTSDHKIDVEAHNAKREVIQAHGKRKSQ